MKKLLSIFTAVLFASFIMTSCSGASPKASGDATAEATAEATAKDSGDVVVGAAKDSTDVVVGASADAKAKKEESKKK